MRNKLLKFSSLSVALVACAFLLTGIRIGGRAEIRQPIQFNHYLHTQEPGKAELECDDCHGYVREAEFAGRPSLASCAMCHEDPQTDSAEEAILVEHIKAGREIPWRRLYTIPSHVYYSHRRHVTVAKITCTECHGEIGLSTSPPGKPLNKLSMKFCMNCHKKQNVTTDCNACHR